VNDATPIPGATAARSSVEADVVVVGGGGSGLAAAVEAASLGRRVILLEKHARLGGTTGRSIGSITATNTPHQIRKGILDSPEHHLEDLNLFNAPLGAPDNEALKRILVDNAPDTFRWLMGMGIEFYGPMIELPHRKPRMHNVLPNSGSYIYHLERKARSLGVEIHTSARVTRLVKEGNRIAGVMCNTARGIQTFRARGGVVLACGDYSASVPFREKYISPEMAAVQPINPTNTGDGHEMVLGLGGRIINGHLSLSGIRFQPPPPSFIAKIPPYRAITRFMNLALERLPGWLLRPFIMSFLTTVLVPSPKLFRNGAVLVNKKGERFTDELEGLAGPLSRQPEQCAYILLDGDLVQKFSAWPHYVSTAPGVAYAFLPDYRRSRRDVYHEAPTLAELAGKIGVPASALEATVRSLSQTASREGRTYASFKRGPYIALGPVRYFINFTDGGVAVNNRLQVLGSGDTPVPGLYAAGLIGMGGVLLEGHGHHLGWAFTSGRLAGRNAAHDVVSADLSEAARPA
jgi:succinate dehydrogenase/fumarate reductase flavoprotein subunit